MDSKPIVPERGISPRLIVHSLGLILTLLIGPMSCHRRHHVFLTWQKSTSPTVTSQKVTRSVGTGDFVPVATLPPDAVHWSDDSPPCGVRLRYTVKAVVDDPKKQTHFESGTPPIEVKPIPCR